MKRGLIDFGDGLNSESDPSEQEPGIIDNISMPEKTVGPTSAVSTSNRTAIKDISITNLKVEFRNMVSNMKAGRKTSNRKKKIYANRPVLLERWGGGRGRTFWCKLCKLLQCDVFAAL